MSRVPRTPATSRTGLAHGLVGAILLAPTALAPGCVTYTLYHDTLGDGARASAYAEAPARPAARAPRDRPRAASEEPHRAGTPPRAEEPPPAPDDGALRFGIGVPFTVALDLATSPIQLVAAVVLWAGGH